MRLIGLAVVLTVGLMLAPFTVEAQQQAGRVWRIGWLSPPPSSTGASELEALREGLRELNYIEGRNLRVEERWPEGDPTWLPGLARALVELKATLAAKQATTTIPEGIILGPS